MVLWWSNQGYVVIGSRRNDDWAVSRATVLAMEINLEFGEGCQAEPLTTP